MTFFRRKQIINTSTDALPTGPYLRALLSEVTRTIIIEKNVYVLLINYQIFSSMLTRLTRQQARLQLQLRCTPTPMRPFEHNPYFPHQNPLYDHDFLDILNAISDPAQSQHVFFFSFTIFFKDDSSFTNNDPVQYLPPSQPCVLYSCCKITV